MIDRGFTIDVESVTRVVILDIPSFMQEKSQLPVSVVDNSQRIATVRLHVQQVIRRLKKSNILNKNISVLQVDLGL